MRKVLERISVLFLSSDIGVIGYDIYTGQGRINFGKTIDLIKNHKSR